MAKPSSASESGVNRSQAIRDALAQHPAASPREIIAMLAGQGIKVTPTLVYFIKSKQKHARPRAKSSASLSPGAEDSIALVVRVKKLAREVGGIRNLKALVDALAE